MATPRRNAIRGLLTLVLANALLLGARTVTASVKPAVMTYYHCACCTPTYGGGDVPCCTQDCLHGQTCCSSSADCTNTRCN